MASALKVVEYLSVPDLDVPEAVALGVALLGLMPADAPSTVRKRAQSLRGATLVLQSIWAERQDAGANSVFVSRLRLANAWGALHDALRAVTRLPPQRERRHLGIGLLQAIFQGKPEFLALPVSDAMLQSGRMLAAIDEEGLSRRISLATGHPEFLEEIREAHSNLQCALTSHGLRQPALSDEPPLERLSNFRAATTDYALQLVAWCRQIDESGFALMESALEPIADLAQGAVCGESTRRLSGISGAEGDASSAAIRVTPYTHVPEVA